ncbi:MAG: ATP-binding protein [Blautia sp.]|nr:ATP-binding protein [Blautia sp.]
MIDWKESDLEELAMIVEIRAKNCYAFEEQIAFSMEADMRNKKFVTNVHKENNFNVLKTVGIYGPNNAGKTCLIKCMRAIKRVLLNKKSGLLSNIFTESDICELGVTFMQTGRKFSYDFKFNVKTEEYIYESFSEIFKDQYNNEKEVCWLKKDAINELYECIDEGVQNTAPFVSNTNLLCYVIDTSKFGHIDRMKQILVEFAKKIDIINMNNIPLQHTIELMKNKNQSQKKVVEFIKNADLYMDNFEFVDMDKIQLQTTEADEKPEERVLDIPENIMDQIRLVSTYKGVHVPSMLFDSTGTKKIAAIARYVIEALEQGRILIVDELDSSIHFKLTRAIVAMFNNELNANAQMIFTVHDINLMDCKKMFRKEQIWFVHKDEEGVYVYSLADFTAQQGVRDTTDVMEKYRKGALGALPDPELIKSLLSIMGNAREEDADEK